MEGRGQRRRAAATLAEAKGTMAAGFGRSGSVAVDALRAAVAAEVRRAEMEITRRNVDPTRRNQSDANVLPCELMAAGDSMAGQKEERRRSPALERPEVTVSRGRGGSNLRRFQHRRRRRRKSRRTDSRKARLELTQEGRSCHWTTANETVEKPTPRISQFGVGASSSDAYV
ncbi:hypothetical protein GW17_00051015 [Ensete ventricosum]|nr:hypothetical protein GW17_00051015 [Ensete ventricosum]